MPMQVVLSAAGYLDQFCLSVSCDTVSSARQASLLRPRAIAPRPAASQLGPTCSVGGSPPRVRAVCLRDDALEGCDGALCDGAPGNYSSLRTSGGRSLCVGCRCPIGACREGKEGTPWAKAPLAPTVNIAKQITAGRMTLLQSWKLPTDAA
jgi:hypothetical protein